MCNVFCKCLACPGKVICCCCKCALNMLLSLICGALVLLLIIGLIVYFAVFYNKDDGDATLHSFNATAEAVTMKSLLEVLSFP